LIEIFLNQNRRSIKIELSDYFRKKAPSSFRKQLLSSGAFTRARAKLKETAFIQLLHDTVHFFQAHVPQSLRSSWHGYRILAVDGSDLTLPDIPELCEEFGTQSNGSDVRVPMAKLSFLYDVNLKMPVDAQLAKKHTSERDLAIQHFEQTKANDLLLYDRGYYAYWFVLHHVLDNREFCLRLKRNACNQVKAFYKSGKKQTIITLEPTDDMRDKAIQRGLKITPIRVRLIRLKTTKEDDYVLMTSLTDIVKYPHTDFYALYHLRWGVEEGFKTQKAFLNVEDFSGRTVHSIKQDVHASVLIQALIAIECFASKPLINKKVKSRSFEYIINFTAAISQFKSAIVGLLSQKVNLDAIYLHLKLIANDLTIVKPDRSFEREKVRCKRQKNRRGYNK